jgi:hypothetical protein
MFVQHGPWMLRMDAKLTQFVAETGADPGLARDLLEGKYFRDTVSSLLLVLGMFNAAFDNTCTLVTGASHCWLRIPGLCTTATLLTKL